MVNHNIEKRQRALDQALRATQRVGASVLALQEVCGWQVDDLRSARPGWTVSYRADHDHATCERSGLRAGSQSPDRGTIGNAVIWTGGPDGRSTGHRYRHQRSDQDRTGMACVSWREGLLHRACSVHLIAPVNGAQIRVRTDQAKDVSDLARRWVARDQLVVLAGDFNAQPHRRTMDHLYAQGGSGDFREASNAPSRGPGCGCHLPTLAARDVKIDYIFFSADRITPWSRPRLRVVPTPSDHHLLVGQAEVDTSVR